MIYRKRFYGALLFVQLLALNLGQSSIQLGPVDMNGFVSQGALVSTDNQYLGTTNQGEFRNTEAAINFIYSPVPQLRLGIQSYVFQLGKYGNMTPILDWATVDYQPYSWFGIRAGRVKLPIGLHNESLDLDLARTWIILPQGIYDARLRELFAAYDGGSFYGNIPLSKAGSLDYNLYAGVAKPGTDSGVADFFADRNPIVFNNFQIGEVVGYALTYNPPVSGLKIGHSLLYVSDVSFQGKVKSGAEFRQTPNNFAAYGNPAGLGALYGGIAGQDARMDSNGFTIWTLYAEYAVNDWTFTTEFAQKHARFVYTYPDPAGSMRNINNTERAVRQQTWYAAVAKRITPWLELGSYYTIWSNDYNDQDGSGASRDATAAGLTRDAGFFYQEDIAFTARFDVTSSWIIKAEAHKVNGTGLLFNNDQQNGISSRSQDWMYFAVKTTYSF
jgi:hypothetical protein